MLNLFQKIDLFVKLANLTPEAAYAILGVSPRATFEDAIKAYKKLALKFHPDVNKSPDAHAKLIELNAVRDFLINVKREEAPQNIVKKEWKDYINFEIEIEDLKYPENIAKAPEIEVKRQRNFEALNNEMRTRKYYEQKYKPPQNEKKKIGII